MAETYEYVVVGLGALGSAAAYQLARRGERVLGLERFELGHSRGASHDSSRILRHSYHTPGYVDLSFAAYDDWAALEADSGERLVTVTGGLDLYPPDPALPMADYTTAMAACGVPFEELDRHEITGRCPQLTLPEGTVGVYQDRAAIVPAGRGVAVLQQLARSHGADLRDESPVTSVRDLGPAGVAVEAGGTTYRCRRVLVCADAWTNAVLAGIGLRLPLTTTVEQVTYFAPEHPDRFAVGRMPLWLWMDDPSFYGFPCYGEPTIKAAQDCGGPVVTPEHLVETSLDDDDPDRLRLLVYFLSMILPGSGPPTRSARCLYTLTPDRDFVVDAVPGHESVLVGLGAAHGFKFAATLGRLLAELAVQGSCATDLSPFRLDRPALVDADHATHWLV